MLGGACDLASFLILWSNPCGEDSDYVLSVPGGQERLPVVEAGVFKTSALVVPKAPRRLCLLR
jgi:hypothetical protein